MTISSHPPGPAASDVPVGPLSPSLDLSTAPVRLMARNGNAALDWFFYDVGNLTDPELSFLMNEINLEGSILVVWPSKAKNGLGVRKFDGYEALRASPGNLLTRFTIAGVGSSDVGAAAFARTVADRYREPVGAIVAGYGVADLVAEALGGWFFYGTANRVLRAYQASMERFATLSAARRRQFGTREGEPKGAGDGSVALGSDTIALVRLLLDEDRQIQSVTGHSKGCLSIAYALESLAVMRRQDAIARARAMRITTAGAVTAFPTGYDNVGQYLGAIDWFGALNSQPDLPRELIMGAWHHLNTEIPMHMDFAAILAREPD